MLLWLRFWATQERIVMVLGHSRRQSAVNSTEFAKRVRFLRPFSATRNLGFEAIVWGGSKLHSQGAGDGFGTRRRFVKNALFSFSLYRILWGGGGAAALALTGAADISTPAV